MKINVGDLVRIIANHAPKGSQAYPEVQAILGQVHEVTTCSGSYIHLKGIRTAVEPSEIELVYET